MKKIKLGLGLTAIASAFIMAFCAQNANAQLLRESTDPESPIVHVHQCPPTSMYICAYLFDEETNTVIGVYLGTRQP